MRRIIALLAGVAAVFVAVAQPVAAEPGAPATRRERESPRPRFLLTRSGLSLAQVAGSGLAVTLDAGASEEHDLVISNHTANLRLTVKLSATDATGNLGTAAASWLAFGDDEVQLDPHVATTVPMTIAVPHDTQPSVRARARERDRRERGRRGRRQLRSRARATQTFPVSIVGAGHAHRADRDRRRASRRQGFAPRARGRAAQLRRPGRAGERARA